MTTVLSLLLFVLLAVWGLHRLARYRFDKQAAMAVNRLVAGDGRQGSVRKPETLPPVLRRHAERSMKNAPWMPRWMLLDLRARMRFKPGSKGATQRTDLFIGIGEPAFVVMTRAAGMPGATLHVHDLFVGGQGRVEARLWGSLPLMIKDKSDMVHVDLHSYLAQIAWAPPALLCNGSLELAETDEGDGLVALEDALLTLRFDAAGDLVEVHAPARPRPMSGQVTPTPWRARYAEFTEMGGFRLPRRCEAAWLLEDGPFVYFEGEVRDLAVGPDITGPAGGPA